MPDESQVGELWIEYVPIDELPEDDRNPKAHADAELDASLERHGFVEPHVVDDRTGRLLAGHGRKAALIRRRDAGKPAPRRIRVDEDGRWLAPVVHGVESIDDDDAAALLVTLNELTIAGGYNPDPLATLLAGLRDRDGLAGTGFTTERVNDLLLSMGPPPSLEDLARERGPSNDEDFWPTLRFKVSPELKARYEQVVEKAKLSGNDTEQFAYLVDTAAKRLRL